MAEDLDRQISKAEEKLSLYSSIPFLIIYGGFLTMIPLIVDIILRMGWMTDWWVFFSLSILASIYIVAAIYIRNNAVKKFYSIAGDKKNFLCTLKICRLSNDASATDITIKSDPSVEEIFSQYKKYERKKIKARLELQVCGPAVFNILYSMAVLIYTISTTQLFTDDTLKYQIGIRGKDVLDIIFFIVSFFGWLWADNLRTKAMEHLLELKQKKYEQEYQKQC